MGNETFHGDGLKLSFLRNAPQGCTVTCPGGLALIYVAHGFFDSQSKAESSNTENF